MEAEGVMCRSRRWLLRVALPLALALTLAPPSPARERYPSRPIMILAYAAGTGSDAIARVFAKALEERLGGTIIVENRPGAGGNLATDAVLRDCGVCEANQGGSVNMTFWRRQLYFMVHQEILRLLC
jgi:tripartite-type tricarboxylate transporter receptor subunit TctC